MTTTWLSYWRPGKSCKHRRFFLFPLILWLAHSLELCGCFPGGSEGKESPWNAGDPGSIPGSGRSSGEGSGSHSGILAWQIPWSEEPGGLQFLGSQRAGTWLSNFQFHLLCGCLKYWIRAECPGGSVSESSCSKCRGPRFNPWSGN